MTSAPIPVASHAQPQRRHVPIHTFLLVFTYILNTVLATSVSIEIAFRPLGIALVVASLLVVTLSLVFHGTQKGAVIATLAVAVLLSVELWRFPVAVVTRTEPWQAVVWLSLLLVTGLVAFRIIRLKLKTATWANTSRSLNVFTVLLLFVVIISGGFSGGLGQLATDAGRLGRPVLAAAKANGPDVILLLLDGYPRADTLQELFSYDNRPFLSQLDALGFEVSEKSRSNYTFTHLTLSSMLNMQFLQEMPAYQAFTSGHGSQRLTMRSLIDGSVVPDWFRTRGYRVVTVPSEIDWVTLHNADEIADTGEMTELEYHLLGATGIAAAATLMQPNLLSSQHGARVLNSLDRLRTLATTDPGGRFIFAHVLSPHAPISLTVDGTYRAPLQNDDMYADLRSQTDLTADEWTAPYRDQLSYLNGRIAETLAAIVDGNPDAVVIAMSDHGSAVYWDPSSAAFSDERLSTLFAARTPGRENPFTDHQTPVNVFPALFNAYFSAGLRLHPDSTFLSSINFVEVPNPDAVK